MNKISINDFTNRELVNAISFWVKNVAYLASPEALAACIKTDLWLGYYQDKLDKENAN